MAQAELQRLLDGVRAALAQPHHQGGLPTQQTLRRVQAALAELQQLPDDAALPAAAPGAAQDAALDSVAALLDRLLAPPAQLFAGLGGGPCEPSSELKEQAATHHALASAQLQLLALLLCQLGRLTLLAPDEQQRDERPGRQRSSRPPVVVGIVEITEEDDSSSSSSAEQQAQARLQQLVQQALVVCALYAGTPAAPAAPVPVSSSAPTTCSLPGSAGLDAFCDRVEQRALQLTSPWSDAGSQQQAQQLLQQLAQQAVMPAAAAAGTEVRGTAEGSSSTAAPAAGAEQQLLERALPQLLERLRDTVMAQHRHRQAQEAGDTGSYQGPATYARCLAARQLACLTLQLRSPLLDEQAGRLLPLLLAVTDDPSPSVQRYGHSALLWLATACQPGALSWQRLLLLDTSRRLVVGCEASCWATALPAATRLVMALEGRCCRGDGYHTLLQELLTEAERGGHKQQQRLLFMACAARLLSCVGLHAARHLSRLLPLLLEWCHAADDASVLAAVRLLGRVAAVAWPRMQAHAALLWRHLVAVLRVQDARHVRLARGGVLQAAEASGAAALDSSSSSQVLQAAVAEVAQLLQLCGGAAFAQAAAQTDASQQQCGGSVAALLQALQLSTTAAAV